METSHPPEIPSGELLHGMSDIASGLCCDDRVPLFAAGILDRATYSTHDVRSGRSMGH